jgi:daunorubicin resistance ABC transporter membrane protein
MTGMGYAAGTIGVLWRRDLLLFFQQRSRLVGALATPLLLWLAIGAGISPSFALPGGDVGYMEYFFPGVILMLLLQVSISATMSVIEDRRQGFLQGVLVAPAPRAAVVLGKTLGSASVALLHALLFGALAPLAGFPYGQVSWLPLLLVAGLSALSLSAMGFMLAWALDSVQGYHVAMNLVLFPLWILSGAMFPGDGLHPLLGTIVRWNPMSYAMSALRRAFYGGAPPDGVSLSGAGPLTELAVLAATTALLLGLACWVASRKPTSS